MPQNEHFEIAKAGLAEAMKFGEYDTAELIAEAQAQATLALAYEQRTASLVALYAAAISIGAQDEATRDLLNQIIDRLGLTEEEVDYDRRW